MLAEQWLGGVFLLKNGLQVLNKKTPSYPTGLVFLSWRNKWNTQHIHKVSLKLSTKCLGRWSNSYWNNLFFTYLPPQNKPTNPPTPRSSTSVLLVVLTPGSVSFIYRTDHNCCTWKVLPRIKIFKTKLAMLNLKIFQIKVGTRGRCKKCHSRIFVFYEKKPSNHHKKVTLHDCVYSKTTRKWMYMMFISLTNWRKSHVCNKTSWAAVETLFQES